jgi:hypothetical protein
MNKSIRQNNYSALRRAGFPSEVANVYKDFSHEKVSAIVEIKNKHDAQAGAEIQKVIMTRVEK